jgi:molecular chaperone GrpE (heat shock protein)
MSGLYDADGIDGPFEKAMKRAMKEDQAKQGAFYGPDPSNEIARLREELAEVTALNSRLSSDNDTLRNTLERERHECPGCERYGDQLADMTAERDALLAARPAPQAKGSEP